MTVDQAIDRAADRLEAFVVRARGEGGVKAKLAEPLAEDPAFLRKLKPSLIAARARGERPQEPRPSKPAAPSGPQVRKRGGGPSPLAVVGIAFAAGIVLAKIVDWRSHAHPRV